MFPLPNDTVYIYLVGDFNPSETYYSSQLGLLFPIYGQIKHVPNHQPVCVCVCPTKTQRAQTCPTLENEQGGGTPYSNDDTPQPTVSISAKPTRLIQVLHKTL